MWLTISGKERPPLETLLQLPYRFPITEALHNSLCCEDCYAHADDDEIARAAQVAQDAQAGYACDYCRKRPRMSSNEGKECSKGYEDLTERVRELHRKTPCNATDE